MTGWLELYGSELLIIAALFVGVGLGLWSGYELGKEHRLPARDAKGRWIKA